MSQFVKVCRKEMPTREGRKFFAYFGYTTDKDGNNQSENSFRIRVCNKLLNVLKDEYGNKYPFILELGDNDYFVTIDRYLGSKKLKLDKDGKEHTILVIMSFASCKLAPRRKLGIKDLH